MSTTGVRELFRVVFSHRSFTLGIFLLLFFPHLFSSGGSKWFGQIGIPRIFSGDEPHYLVTINSLYKNHTFDLRQAYQSALEGSFDAGRSFAGVQLDHHTGWYWDNTYHFWASMVVSEPSFFTKNEQGKLVFQFIPSAPSDLGLRPEYSFHPLSFAVILAPFLYWFKNTDWIEPLALLCRVWLLSSDLFCIGGCSLRSLAIKSSSIG